MAEYRSNLNEKNWKEFFDELNNETPRAVVVISGAFLDSLLRDLLATFMIECSEVDELLGTDEFFETPLSNFGVRNKLAFCLGLISEIEFKDIRRISKIRNRFSHEIHGFTFDNKYIVDLCNKLQTPTLLNGSSINLELPYNKYTTTVSILLMQLGLKVLGVQKERRTIKANMQMAQMVSVNILGNDNNLVG